MQRRNDTGTTRPQSLAFAASIPCTPGVLPRSKNRAVVSTSLGKKDLIIRMLAEVFHVQHSPIDGQPKWRQVSSSLVPITLYSRTTRRWLDYLLTASTLAQPNTSSAMSPDSRDYLLLLQQFQRQHSATQHRVPNASTSSTSNQANIGRGPSRDDLQQNPIVFQVSAHDFLDGQCYKILNVKLAQPGSHLGLASDHFVWWKERSLVLLPVASQTQAKTSFSNAELGEAQHQLSLTWGLNFASANDAKLFYDICSLNIVDLGYDSNFYRQLMRFTGERLLSDERQFLSHSTDCANQPRRLASYNQAKNYSLGNTYSNNKRAANTIIARGSNTNYQILPSEAYKQSSPWPVGLVRGPSRQDDYLHNQELNNVNHQTLVMNPNCPVHQNKSGLSSRPRTRSKSSTRSTRQIAPDSSEYRQKDALELKPMRTRSISMPASPDKDSDLAFISGGQNSQKNHGASIVHEPGCQTLLKQRQQKPEKPVRGLMRDPEHSSSQTYKGDINPPNTDSKNQAKFFDQMMLDERIASQFAGSKAAGRRFTGIEGDMKARLARARYANSKNLKEFLSLDAGNAQYLVPVTTPAKSQQPRDKGPEEQKNTIAQQAHPVMQIRLAKDLVGHSNRGRTNLENRATSTDDLPLNETNKCLFSGQESESMQTSRHHNEQPRAASLGRELNPMQEMDSTKARRRSLERSHAMYLVGNVPTEASRFVTSDCMPVSLAKETKASDGPGKENQMANDKRFKSSRADQLESSTDGVPSQACHCALASSTGLTVCKQMNSRFKSALTVSEAELVPGMCFTERKPIKTTRPPMSYVRSSYAIPLSSEYEEDDFEHESNCNGTIYKRKARSCPNSLRRKPKLTSGLVVSQACACQQLCDTCCQSDQRLSSHSAHLCLGHQIAHLCQRPQDQQRPWSSMSSHSPQGNLFEDGIENSSWVGQHSTRCTQRLKPIAGYDQTLARASLRSRQRPRSQPPGRSSVSRDEDSASFHILSKSMENVERLIREVQTELETLRRRPLIHMPVPDVLQGRYQVNDSNDLLWNSRTISGLDMNAVGSSSANNQTQDAARATVNNNRAQMGPNLCSSESGLFRCNGAIRKAGFLSVKKWIVQKQSSIELARKQNWRRYWVCLRGTSLLFYPISNSQQHSPARQPPTKVIDLLAWIHEHCANESQIRDTLHNLTQHQNADGTTIHSQTPPGSDSMLARTQIESEPKHLIIIEGALAQSIPEHPKRDFVFCLSTALGDAYLFQSDSQSESDQWICALHNACAASIARDLTRKDAIKLFENKIKQLELEAEKKIFLRQRLESRLISMSSMSGLSDSPLQLASLRAAAQNISVGDIGSQTGTLRSLLQRLNQQLSNLDTYVEQVHCEIYQLRCYLASCIHVQTDEIDHKTGAMNNFEVPHPKNLLIHVSKQTKLILIKLGVFTASSFHAYVHARLGYTNQIFDRIQPAKLNEESQLDNNTRVTDGVRRCQSIGESLSSQDRRMVDLENNTEQLIRISDLKLMQIRISRELLEEISHSLGLDIDQMVNSSSDDLVTVEAIDKSIALNMKLNSKFNAVQVIEQILIFLNQGKQVKKSQVLEYYLRFVCKENEEGVSPSTSPYCFNRKNSLEYVAKQRETIDNWPKNFDYLQLEGKIVFGLELVRNSFDDEESGSEPFGISVSAQLIHEYDPIMSTSRIDPCPAHHEAWLNVYCSYIEWGSVADKAGLKDEDELIAINEIPVIDLDMMFIEQIIRNEPRIKLVIRSCRNEAPPEMFKPPPKPIRRSSKGDGDDSDDENRDHRRVTTKSWADKGCDTNTTAVGFLGASSVITDEYISTLVCPPPPDRLAIISSINEYPKFQKTAKTIIQSENNNTKVSAQFPAREVPSDELRDQDPIQNGGHLVDGVSHSNTGCIVSNGVQGLGNSSKQQDQDNENTHHELASDLTRKTEQLSKMLGRDTIDLWDDSDSASKELMGLSSNGIDIGLNPKRNYDKLRKTLLELFETEYAYIRQIDVIQNHYMIPLEEVSYLEIPDLKFLHDVITCLLANQGRFFDELTKIFRIRVQDNSQSINSDQLEKIDNISRHITECNHETEFEEVIQAIADKFLQEAGSFKIYASYCAAYSRFQKLLQTRDNGSSTSFTSTVIDSINRMSRVSKPSDLLSTLMGPINSANTSAKMRELYDFLTTIDSSSSSVSMSLSESSTTMEEKHKNTKVCQGAIKIRTPTQRSLPQQNFESYLMKPILRIVKYPLLLDSIANAANGLINKGVQEKLLNSVKKMESVASHVNDTQRIHDEFGQVFENIERNYLDRQLESKKGIQQQQSISHPPKVNLRIENLLFFGPVEWLNAHEFSSKFKKGTNTTQHVFVFSSCVVFISRDMLRSSKGNTSETVRYQTILPVTEVQVRSVPKPTGYSSAAASNTNADSESDTFEWELIRCSSTNSNSSLLTNKTGRSNRRDHTGKIYLLSCTTNDLRTSFLRNIRQTIRESVRNMSLPLSRSCSSKFQESPKKIISPSLGTTNSSSSRSGSLSPS